jgi:hypothetical protein
MEISSSSDILWHHILLSNVKPTDDVILYKLPNRINTAYVTGISCSSDDGRRYLLGWLGWMTGWPRAGGLQFQQLEIYVKSKNDRRRRCWLAGQGQAQRHATIQWQTIYRRRKIIMNG